MKRGSRGLEERGLSEAGIRTLVEEKLISALRREVANMTLVELHENRRGFGKAVMENLKDALLPHGLTLEEMIRETHLLEQSKLHEIKELEKMRTIEEAEREKEIAIILKETEKIKEEIRRFEIEALKEETSQKLLLLLKRPRQKGSGRYL